MGIGIMQGRLVAPTEGHIQCFPKDDWREEFGRGAKAGLEFIEWIYDEHGADVNPIGTDTGIALISQLSAEHNIAVRSVCADWFMTEPLVRADSTQLSIRVAKLGWLLRRASALGVHHVVLPFVDSSSIVTADDESQVVAVLRSVLPIAESMGVELHLETSLPPERFGALLARVVHPLVRVNYDSGNSASLGYDVAREFAVYGDRVGSVHIKDRTHNGGTVPLGAGDADLRTLARSLKAVTYSGDFVLQVARGATGDEVRWAAENRAYVERLLTAEA